MVTDSLSIASVEERARDIVLALDGAAYKQGPANPEWRETRSLRIRDEAASVVHLRFHAAVDSAQSNGGHRGSPRGTEQVESELIVAFVYHLRPATRGGPAAIQQRRAGCRQGNQPRHERGLVAPVRRHFHRRRHRARTSP